MKVLVINWRDAKNPEAGGAEIHIDEILQRKPIDWQVDFVSASFKGATKTETFHDYQIIRIPNNWIFNFTFYFYWFLKFKKKKYDLIIDDISKIPLATPSYIKSIPLVSIQHHIHGKSLFKQFAYPIAKSVYEMERFFLKFYQSTPVIAVSESTCRELQESFGYKNLSVIHNGIDFEALKNGYEPGKEKAPILIYFGRLKKYKRVDHAIQAFKSFQKNIPTAKLWIAGRGDDEGRLKKIVVDENLYQSVEFLGFIDEAKKQTLFNQAFLFLLPSEKEGWGITVLEANATGLPTIGYDIEGLRDSIQTGVTGVLIENGNVSKMAEVVLGLWNKKQKYAEMSENAFQWASNFSWDKKAADFYAFANQAIDDFNVKNLG